MLFGHDTEHALACVVDLVNTEADDEGSDGLATLADLADLVERHGVSEVGALAAEDLSAVRRLRARFRQVFECRDDASAAVLVNRLVEESPVTPRLTDHDGYPWHVHYFAPGARVAEHLAVDGGMALAQVVAAGERGRLRVCDADDCTQVLVDLSRNRSRRYCDARTCGNRMHVAAYRERLRAADGT